MLRPSTLLRHSTALALLPILLGGCAVGPDFQKPEAPSASSYGPGPMNYATASAPTEMGGMQRFAIGGDVPAAWWSLFQSASLSHLLTQAIEHNPNLEAARASLRVAEEQAAAGYGSFFPSLDGSMSTSRQRTTQSPQPFTLYNTSVAVSYVPDVFGGTRRATEALDAKTDASRFEVEAAYLTLTGNVVTTAIQEASLRDQIAAYKAIIDAQQKQLDIMKTQLDVGAIAKPAYLSQAALLASTQASLPAMEKQLVATRHMLAVLMGQLPSQEIGASFELSSFKLPEEVPVSLPSQLVEQRPDIRAARANLQAANAQIGVAMDAMLPHLSLTGNYGVGASRVDNLFTPGTALWGLAAGLSQPLFHGGELLHQKRAAEAAFDASAASYRATVLSAFQNVADSLKALESDAETLKAQAAAEQAAAQTLETTTQQFNAGAINAIALLSAQTSYQQAKIALIKAKAARLADTASLFQALGGGWWNRPTK